MSQSPQGRVTKSKELGLSFCWFRSVSKLGFADLPSPMPYALTLQRACPAGPLWTLCLWLRVPACAFPWSEVLGKLLPAFLCFFRNDDRKGEVYKWSNIIWKKVSAKSNPQWEDCLMFFFFSFFFLPPFQKIVKTQATHTCKRIKKKRENCSWRLFSPLLFGCSLASSCWNGAFIIMGVSLLLVVCYVLLQV